MNQPDDDTGSTAPRADAHAGAPHALDAEALDRVVAGLGPATPVRSGGDPTGTAGTRAGTGANQGAHELTHTVQQRSPGTP